MSTLASTASVCLFLCKQKHLGSCAAGSGSGLGVRVFDFLLKRGNNHWSLSAVGVQSRPLGGGAADGEPEGLRPGVKPLSAASNLWFYLWQDAHLCLEQQQLEMQLHFCLSLWSKPTASGGGLRDQKASLSPCNAISQRHDLWEIKSDCRESEMDRAKQLTKAGEHTHKVDYFLNYRLIITRVIIIFQVGWTITKLCPDNWNNVYIDYRLCYI